MPEWLEIYANPSAVHSAGKKARDLLEKARASIVTELQLDSYKLIFTSTGTEANALALQFLFSEEIDDRREILISSIEHSCIYELKNSLTAYGYRVKQIPVDKNGIIDLDFVEEHCTDETALVSVMLANNETGVIQPLKEIRRITDEYGIYFHCDAIQGIGKMENQLKEIDADSYAFSGHKLHALKGVSCTVYRTKPTPIFIGGGQERGLRAGTENLLGIFSLEKAISLIMKNEKKNHKTLLQNRNFLESELEKIGGTIISKSVDRLFNTSCVEFTIENEKMLIELDKRNIAVSRGSACNAGSWEPSRSLLSMKISKERANRIIRISQSIFNTKSEINNLVESIKEILN
jgi:cysteine desulfurase